MKLAAMVRFSHQPIQSGFDHRLGRFLLGILRDLSTWHKDERQYLQDNRDKRGTTLPGFQRGKLEKKSLTPEDLYDWEKFKQLHNKWHKKLAVVRVVLTSPISISGLNHRLESFCVPSFC